MVFICGCGGGSGSGGASADLPAGIVTTIAGSATVPGDWAEGTGIAARFNQPVGIAADNLNLYIADCANNRIRKMVIATGAVNTLAGTGNQATADDSPTMIGQFNHPRGIATAGTWLYVTEPESGSGQIRRVNIATGKVSTITMTGVALAYPTGITTDGANLYVSNRDSNAIIKVAIDTGVSTYLATTDTFSQPIGITTDGSSLYVNDFGNNAIKKVFIATGQTSTLTTLVTNPSMGIVMSGANLYVADYGNNRILMVATGSGAVTILAGSSVGMAGSADGTKYGASFKFPEGIASDGKVLFICDSGNNTIRRLK
jgi:sugar lactone lactonase YvrE